LVADLAVYGIHLPVKQAVPAVAVQQVVAVAVILVLALELPVKVTRVVLVQQTMLPLAAVAVRERWVLREQVQPQVMAVLDFNLQ